MLAHVLVGVVAAAVSREPGPLDVPEATLLVVTGLPALKASVAHEALYAVVGSAPLAAVVFSGSLCFVTGQGAQNNQISQSSTLYAVVTE